MLSTFRLARYIIIKFFIVLGESGVGPEFDLGGFSETSMVGDRCLITPLLDRVLSLWFMSKAPSWRSWSCCQDPSLKSITLHSTPHQRYPERASTIILSCPIWWVQKFPLSLRSNLFTKSSNLERVPLLPSLCPCHQLLDRARSANPIPGGQHL